MSDQAFVSRRMKSRRHRLAGVSVAEGSLWLMMMLQQSSPAAQPAATKLDETTNLLTIWFFITVSELL